MPQGPPTEKDLLTQYALRKAFWTPRDRRMDFHYLTYKLFDAHQQAKPPGRQRFTTNEPANLIDKGANAIAKNQFRFKCPIDNLNDPYERETVARYEDLAYGIVDEIDESLVNRGASGNLREIMSKQALLRGWIAGCEILQPDDERGMVYFDDWDPRFTYPDWDRWGLRSVLYYTEDHLGNVIGDHPWLDDEFTADDDMNQLVIKYVWYDRTYYGCLAELPHRDKNNRARRQKTMWISRDPDTEVTGPYEHGLPDIPAYMIPVNGLNFRYSPTVPSDPFQSLQFNQDFRMAPSDYDRYRYGPNNWVADRGRSIFANVENEFRQFNELVATIWQVVSNEAYGTWTFKSRDGKAVDLEIGNNAVNFLRLDEALDKINPHVAPPNITDLLSISSANLEKGTFSFKMFGSDFQGSGFLFNQAQEAMSSALYPFKAGVERAGERVARIGTRQFRLGNFRDINMTGQKPGSRRIFSMKMSSDDFDKDYKITAELQLAVPEDLLARVQIAKLLADPRKPLASLQTIFDKVLGWDDPDGEKEKIFEDVADTDPIIVLERTARALERRGLPELAASIREKEFTMAAVQAMQKAQMEGNLQQVLGQGGGGAPGAGGPGGGAGSEAGGSTVSPPNPTAHTGPQGDMSATAPAGGPF
jgi:hypothetical protein